MQSNTKSRVRAKKVKGGRPASRINPVPETSQKPENFSKYESMHLAVQKISDPVELSLLKDFYGLNNSK